MFKGSKTEDDKIDEDDEDEEDNESADEQPDTTDMRDLESDESAEQTRKQKGHGLKILTPQQMLSRLPISLVRLKAGNNSDIDKTTIISAV